MVKLFDAGEPLKPTSYEEFEAEIMLTHLRRIRLPSPDRDCPFLISLLLGTKRVPNWRWELANYFVFQRGQGIPRLDEDAYYALCLLDHRRKNTPPAPHCYAAIDAILIYEQNARERWLIESHLLLPVRPQNLSQKLQISPTALQLYESWFFDVRPRLGFSGWMLSAMPPPSGDGQRAEDYWAPIWSRVAYRGSERDLDLAIALFVGVSVQVAPGREREDMRDRIDELRPSVFSKARKKRRPRAKSADLQNLDASIRRSYDRPEARKRDAT